MNVYHATILAINYPNIIKPNVSIKGFICKIIISTKGEYLFFSIASYNQVGSVIPTACKEYNNQIFI